MIFWFVANREWGGLGSNVKISKIRDWLAEVYILLDS